MRLYLDSVVSLLQDRTAEELIVGVFLALLLAIAGAGVHALARRKVQDTVMLLTVVGLVANLVVMIATAGYVRMKLKGPAFPQPGGLAARPTVGPSQARDLTIEAAARGVLRAADADRDGMLTPQEAAAAADQFVRAVESESGTPARWDNLSNAIKRQVRFPDGHPGNRELPPWSDPGRPLTIGEPGPTLHPPMVPRM